MCFLWEIPDAIFHSAMLELIECDLHGDERHGLAAAPFGVMHRSRIVHRCHYASCRTQQFVYDQNMNVEADISLRFSELRMPSASRRERPLPQACSTSTRASSRPKAAETGWVPFRGRETLIWFGLPAGTNSNSGPYNPPARAISRSEESYGGFSNLATYACRDCCVYSC